MSTDQVTEQETGRDDGYEAPLRPPGADMGDEQETEAAPPVGWLPDADEETTKYLASRGWDKDPSALLRSQRESEAALRREQEARASMERELAEARETISAAARGPIGQPQDDDPFQLKAAARAYEDGQISMDQLVEHQAAVTLDAARRIAEEIVGQRVEPIQSFQTTRTLQETAAQLEQTYPDFRELSEDVLALIEKYPAKYGDAEGMRAAYGLVRSERDAQLSRERSRASAAETLDSGSRGNVAPDAAEAIRKQLRDLGGPRDGL